MFMSVVLHEMRRVETLGGRANCAIGLLQSSGNVAQSKID